jgi:hypothetical protein
VTGVPAGAIYIGRGSKWGNPFRIGADGDRAAVIAKRERWVADQHHLLARSTSCAAATSSAFTRRSPCHGDLLRRLDNAGRDERIA